MRDGGVAIGPKESERRSIGCLGCCAKSDSLLVHLHQRRCLHRAPGRPEIALDCMTFACVSVGQAIDFISHVAPVHGYRSHLA